MRYRLRTLLITATIAPPLLAAAMWFAGYGGANPILLFAAGYISLIVVLLVVSSLMEAGNAAPGRSFHGSIAAAVARCVWRRPAGTCSFCGLPKRPLAEGIRGVLICRECAAACAALIDDKEARKNDQATMAESAGPRA
jgi:hypothetical protein